MELERCRQQRVIFAAEFLQKELTPLAMRSSCEGYTELKQSLLALVTQEEQDQPQVAAWDLSARDRLASCLGRTVRQGLGITTTFSPFKSSSSKCDPSCKCKLALLSSLI